MFDKGPVFVEFEVGAVVQVMARIALLLLRFGLGDDDRLAAFLLELFVGA